MTLLGAVVGRPVVAVHHDNRELAIACRSVPRRAGSTIVADVLVADHLTLTHFAMAILDGLGKDPRLYSIQRPSEPLAGAWLITDQVENVLVLDAQLIPHGLVAEVSSWLCGLGVTPWFCCATAIPRSPAAGTEAIMAALGVEPGGADYRGEEELLRVLNEAKEDPPAAPAARSLPIVPRVDGLAFRDAARRCLAAEDFAVVDEAFTSSVRRFVEAFRDVRQSPPGHTATRLACKFLRQEIDGAPDTEALLVCVRAAQVAALNTGWAMSVRTTQLLGAAAAFPRAGQAGPQRWWEGLDGYRDPEPGALAAMLHSGVAMPTTHQLTLGQLEIVPGGDVAVRQAETEVTVSGPGARFVRALVYYRRLCGMGPADSLLSTHRRPDATTRRFVTNLLRVPEYDLGIQVVEATDRWPARADDQWLARYGIHLEGFKQRSAR